MLKTLLVIVFYQNLTIVILQNNVNTFREEFTKEIIEESRK